MKFFVKLADVLSANDIELDFFFREFFPSMVESSNAPPFFIKKSYGNLRLDLSDNLISDELQNHEESKGLDPLGNEITVYGKKKILSEEESLKQKEFNELLEVAKDSILSALGNSNWEFRLEDEHCPFWDFYTDANYEPINKASAKDLMIDKSRIDGLFEFIDSIPHQWLSLRDKHLNTFENQIKLNDSQLYVLYALILLTRDSTGETFKANDILLQAYKLNKKDNKNPNLYGIRELDSNT